MPRPATSPDGNIFGELVNTVEVWPLGQITACLTNVVGKFQPRGIPCCKFAMLFRISAIITAILYLAACDTKKEAIAAAERSQESEILSASVDDLIITPTKYSGRRVRVTGYWIQQFEYSALHSEPKLTTMSLIWVERWSLPGGREVKDPQSITAAVNAAYKDVASNRAQKRDVLLVTLEGYFDHKDTIDPTKDSHPFQSGFGHLGQYSSQFTIERVDEIKLVSEEPFPL